MFLLRSSETTWRSARTMKLYSKSSLMPLLWLWVSQRQLHRGESTHLAPIHRKHILHFELEVDSYCLLWWNQLFGFKQILSFNAFSSQLNEDELKQLEEACDMALELNQSKHGIYDYVESRMSFIAPNLSVIVGASTAAKIMGEECKKTSLLLFHCILLFMPSVLLSGCRYCWRPH